MPHSVARKEAQATDSSIVLSGACLGRIGGHNQEQSLTKMCLTKSGSKESEGTLKKQRSMYQYALKRVCIRDVKSSGRDPCQSDTSLSRQQNTLTGHALTKPVGTEHYCAQHKQANTFSVCAAFTSHDSSTIIQCCHRDPMAAFFCIHQEPTLQARQITAH
jgi:hypothetical protein